MILQRVEIKAQRRPIILAESNYCVV